MAAVKRALVVGGGIGGLVASIALRRQGIAVDLVEIKAEWAVYGVGIMQPNNALRALDRVGLASQCVADGNPFPGWATFDVNGDAIGQIPVSNAAAPAYPPMNGIPRPLLHQILTRNAAEAGVEVWLGVSVAQSVEQGDHISVRFTDGRQGAYDVVIGADGAYSDMRTRLFGADVKPVSVGEGVWRYNLPRPAEVTWGHTYFGPRNKVGLVPLSRTLMYLFIVSAEPFEAFYPPESLAEMMRERLSDYTGLIGQLRDLIQDSDKVVYRPLEYLQLPSPWHVGRSILIGDAAHLTTPHMAQGASIAIEDAVLLAELLGGCDDYRAAFEQFMAQRFERDSMVVDASLQLAEWELAEWRGAPAPDADPIGLIGRVTHRLLTEH